MPATHNQDCFGAEAETCHISKSEVANAQCAELLSAVAMIDPNALYNVRMGSLGTEGGITRSGGPGSSRYSTIAGCENVPAVHASFYDALRIAIWLHNGQPIWDHDGTTIDGGSHTITAQGITGNTTTCNTGAAIFLGSENEWCKAAYCDPVSMSYFDYAAGTNTRSVCAVSGATADTANCDLAVVNVIDVESDTRSASPYGTFDQGGSAFEWNEAIITVSPRGTRGGGFDNAPTRLEAANQNILVGPARSMGLRVSSPIFVRPDCSFSFPEPTRLLSIIERDPPWRSPDVTPLERAAGWTCGSFPLPSLLRSSSLGGPPLRLRDAPTSTQPWRRGWKFPAFAGCAPRVLSAAARQSKPTPLLPRYEQAEYDRLHQDRYGEIAFPLQAEGDSALPKRPDARCRPRARQRLQYRWAVAHGANTAHAIKGNRARTRPG